MCLPVSSGVLLSGWTKVGEGEQARSSDEAKTCRPQDKLCSIFESESVSLFPLIFCKLIVRLVLDTMQYAQFKFQKTEEPLCLCLFADVRTGL